jgi:hypothetical protein
MNAWQFDIDNWRSFEFIFLHLYIKKIIMSKDMFLAYFYIFAPSK